MASWEQVRQFVMAARGQTTHLSCEQKSHFVCLRWIRQIYSHFADTKESYVADWDRLPAWQQETDADIFEAIEESVLPEVARI